MTGQVLCLLGCSLFQDSLDWYLLILASERLKILSFIILAVGGIVYGIVSSISHFIADRRIATWKSKDPSVKGKIVLNEGVIRSIARRAETQEDFERKAHRYLQAKEQTEKTKWLLNKPVVELPDTKSLQIDAHPVKEEPVMTRVPVRKLKLVEPSSTPSTGSPAK
jgi:hypothetical protein